MLSLTSNICRDVAVDYARTAGCAHDLATFIGHARQITHLPTHRRFRASRSANESAAQTKRALYGKGRFRAGILGMLSRYIQFVADNNKQGNCCGARSVNRVPLLNRKAQLPA